MAQILALVGLDGGNARALANARGVLDNLHATQERINELETRIGRRASSQAERGAGRDRTSVQPIMSRPL